MPTGSTFPRSLEVELGTPGVHPNAVTGISWVDQWEDVPELRWPTAGRVYDKMRKDGQVAGCIAAVVRPILARARFRLGTQGADTRVVRFLEVELGLGPEDRSVAKRRRQGIVFREYARTALNTKARFGHAVFEQVYDIGPPLPEQAEAGITGVVAHLRKLGERPPRSLGDPLVAADGGLIGWKQVVARPDKPWAEIVLPIDRLVVHVLEKEAADWRGMSMLRPAWKHWAIRDVLMRVGAMAVERNGMGIPVVTYDETVAGVSRTRALQLAKAVRAGDEAAVALPAGYELNLLGVAGQVRDELPLLKFHGEMIGRAFQAMVLDLGHDAGARSLGDTFLDVLCMAQNALAADFAREVTEYVCRDLVELNFGQDEPVPPVIHDELEPTNITWDDVINMAKVGLIVPDDNLERDLRQRRGVPLWPGSDVISPPVTLEVEPVPPVLPAPAPALVPAARAAEQLATRAAAVHATLEARRAARAR